MLLATVMTNMQGVGGAPRGLRTQQPILHGEPAAATAARQRHHLRNQALNADSRLQQLQRAGKRQRDERSSQQQTASHHKQRKLAPTTLSSTNKSIETRRKTFDPTSNSKPANLKGDDQGDHAKSRAGRVTAGGKVPTPHSKTNYPGKGEKIWTDSNTGEGEYPLFEDNNNAKRTKGAHGTTSKGEEHR